MAFLWLAAALVWLTSPQEPAGSPPQAPLIYVRPEAAAPGAEIGREMGARDDDPLGTYSWATRAFSRSCTANGGCSGTSSAATVWEQFPAGFKPRGLIVYWKAASSVAMFGGSSQVRAVVEYSTNGEVWTPIDRFVQNGTLLYSPMKRVEAKLAPTVKPESLKVRGRLEVQLISCPVDDCAANLPNPSNLSGQIWIADIRLEVDPPQLTATRDRVKAGETVTFAVEGAPGARVSNWQFRPVGGTPTVRDERHTEATWPLTVTESGTVTVTVELDGQPQLKRRRFELSRAISIRRR